MSKSLEDFVTCKSFSFFNFLNIDISFLEEDPSNWKNNESYADSKEVVKSLKVVNDCAERVVKLVQDFNAVLTKDEEQQKYVLNLVAENRAVLPDAKKSTLSAKQTRRQ